MQADGDWNREGPGQKQECREGTESVPKSETGTETEKREQQRGNGTKRVVIETSAHYGNTPTM